VREPPETRPTRPAPEPSGNHRQPPLRRARAPCVCCIEATVRRGDGGLSFGKDFRRIQRGTATESSTPARRLRSGCPDPQEHAKPVGYDAVRYHVTRPENRKTGVNGGTWRATRSVGFVLRKRLDLALHDDFEVRHSPEGVPVRRQQRKAASETGSRDPQIVGPDESTRVTEGSREAGSFAVSPRRCRLRHLHADRAPGPEPTGGPPGCRPAGAGRRSRPPWPPPPPAR
jgi:hypothetical protein